MTDKQKIAELEKELRIITEMVDELAGGMERKGISLHDWMLNALRPIVIAARINQESQAEAEFWKWMEKVAPETMKQWRRHWADELGRETEAKKHA